MNLIEVIGRMMLALGVVLVVMWLIAKWVRKPLAGKTDRVMTVLARQQLSRSASVAVVKVADRALVLGVTEQGVRLLTETDLHAIEQALEVSEKAPSRRGTSTRVIEDEYTDELENYSYPGALEAAQVADPAPGRSAHRAVRSQSTVKSHSAVKSHSSAGTTRILNTSGNRGSLDGSILSPKVWRQLMQGARDITVRR